MIKITLLKLRYWHKAIFRNPIHDNNRKTEERSVVVNCYQLKAQKSITKIRASLVVSKCGIRLFILEYFIFYKKPNNKYETFYEITNAGSFKNKIDWNFKEPTFLSHEPLKINLSFSLYGRKRKIESAGAVLLLPRGYRGF